jgi:peptidoglycan/LPS O-acetylase OafA/YrhL
MLSSIEKAYRPDLNGLRGLSVLLVLFFHLDLEYFKGGFLGVDVFFVLSGYFISKNILFDIENKKFSFLVFYQKRIRRLFPALFTTLLLTLVAGYFYLTANNYERLASSAQYSVFSLSNFFFYLETGYFDTSSKLKPLLHMWSLSVEEQFYLFWPLLLFIICKLRKAKGILVLTVLFLASLLSAEYFLNHDPSLTFFMFPFRIFEFGFGFIALLLEQKNKLSNKALELLFISGFGLILLPSVLMSESIPMPGFNSLYVMCGSLFLILGGKAQFTSKILDNPIMELIGKASYSIYLVHWPLIAFAKHSNFQEFTPLVIVVLFVASLLLGFGMWYYIENYFRKTPDIPPSRDKVWLIAPMTIVILWGLGMLIKYEQGFPKLIEQKYNLNKAIIEENKERYFQRFRGKYFKSNHGSTKNVVIMGNSHSIDLIYMLKENGFKPNITRFNSLGKCYNFGASANKDTDIQECKTQLQNNLMDDAWRSADMVFLHDNWPNFKGDDFENILNQISDITDAPIYVIGPKMTYNKDIPEIITLSQNEGVFKLNEFAKKFEKFHLKERVNDSIERYFSNSSLDNEVYFIDLLRLQGGKQLDSFEIVSDNFAIYYFDFNHFTIQGAKNLGARLKVNNQELFIE